MLSLTTLRSRYRGTHVPRGRTRNVRRFYSCTCPEIDFVIAPGMPVIITRLETLIFPLLNSTAATWGLFELATNPEVQTRLRNELLAVDNDNPSMDELNALPYLDCFVRETLRAHAPVPLTCACQWHTRIPTIPLMCYSLRFLSPSRHSRRYYSPGNSLHGSQRDGT